MARYFLVRYSQTGDAALREERRGHHIAYRKSLGEALLLAGPLVSESEAPVGSVVILAAADAEEAQATAGGDPFVKAGLLSIDTIEEIRIAMMRPPPG